MTLRPIKKNVGVVSSIEAAIGDEPGWSGVVRSSESSLLFWKWHQIQRFLERSVFGIAMTVTQWCNDFILKNQVVIMLDGVQGVFVSARAKDYPTLSPEIAMPQNRRV